MDNKRKRDDGGLQAAGEGPPAGDSCTMCTAWEGGAGSAAVTTQPTKPAALPGLAGNHNTVDASGSATQTNGGLAPNGMNHPPSVGCAISFSSTTPSSEAGLPTTAGAADTLVLEARMQGRKGSRQLRMNTQASLMDLRAQACEAWGLGREAAPRHALWDLQDSVPQAVLPPDLHLTLQEALMLDQQAVELRPLVEADQVDGAATEEVSMGCNGSGEDMAVGPQGLDDAHRAIAEDGLCGGGEAGVQGPDAPPAALHLLRGVGERDPPLALYPPSSPPLHPVELEPIAVAEAGPATSPVQPALAHVMPPGGRAAARLAARQRAAQQGAHTLTLQVLCEGREDVKEVKLPDSSTVGRLKRQACEAHSVAPRYYGLWDFWNQDGEELHAGHMSLTLRDKKLVDNQQLKLKRAADAPHTAPVPEGEEVEEEEDTAAANISAMFDNPDSVGEERDAAPLALEYSTSGAGAFSPVAPAFGPRNHGRGLFGTHGASTLGLGQSYRSTYNDDTAHEAAGRGPGVAGLSNLGNTCFMNSSLQCLGHTPALLEAFLSGRYLTDINPGNPLGMQGELARGFGQLMSLLWQGDVGYVTPRRFKERIGRFAPQFSGYAQHDSQEFLAFLLDGLHEDLNRIKVKPYIEEGDSKGRPEAELAAEAWSNYRARNDSTVVDHFQGLYKSRLDCPHCGYTSTKFDPFMYLSLPLPESRMRGLTLTVVFLGAERPPLRCLVEVPNAGTVRDVQAAVWRLLSPEILAQGPLWPGDNDAASTQLLSSGPQPPPPPAPPMLCVKMARAYGGVQEDVEVFTPGTRVAEVIPSPRVAMGETLIVYLYPPEAVQRRLERMHAPPPTAAVRTGPAAAFALAQGLSVPSAAGQQPTGSSMELGSGDEAASAQQSVAGDAVNGVAHPLSAPQQGPVPKWTHDPPDEAGLPFGLPFAQGTVPLVVHHRSAPKGPFTRSSMMMVPLVLWLPAAAVPASLAHPDIQPAEAAVSSGRREWGVHGTLRARVDAAMEAALWPYRTPCRAGEATDDVASVSAVAMDGIAAQNEAAAAEEHADGDGDGQGSPAGAPGAHDPVEPAPGPHTVASSSSLFSSSGADGSCRGAGSGGSSSSSTVDAVRPWPSAHSSPFAAGPRVQPFDMWAAQSQPQPQAADLATQAQLAVAGGVQEVPVGPEADVEVEVEVEVEDEGWAAVPQPAYRLLVSDARATTTFFGHVTPRPELGNGDAPIWHFVCEWAADGGGRWNVGRADLGPCDHVSIASRGTGHHASVRPPVTLQACVQAFLQPEQLSEEDSWYCPQCKEHVQADKKLDLWTLPDTLVVHLKRFSYTRYSRDKLDTPVLFPHLLDLSEYLPNNTPSSAAGSPAGGPDGGGPGPMSEDSGLHSSAEPVPEAGAAASAGGPQQPWQAAELRLPPAARGARPGAHTRYRLYGVVNHFGSMGGGHYTAYARMPGSEQWYLFDDSSVHPADPGDVVSPAAYVLFYRSLHAEAADPPGLLQHLLGLRAAAQEAAAVNGCGGGGGADGSANNSRLGVVQDAGVGTTARRASVVGAASSPPPGSPPAPHLSRRSSSCPSLNPSPRSMHLHAPPRAPLDMGPDSSPRAPTGGMLAGRGSPAAASGLLHGSTALEASEVDAAFALLGSLEAGPRRGGSGSGGGWDDMTAFDIVPPQERLHHADGNLDGWVPWSLPKDHDSGNGSLDGQRSVLDPDDLPDVDEARTGAEGVGEGDDGMVGDVSDAMDESGPPRLSREPSSLLRALSGDSDGGSGARSPQAGQHAGQGSPAHSL